MKNFLIVGGSSGIGKALVSKMEGTGNKVYGTFNQNSPKQSSSISYHHVNVLENRLDLDFLPDKLHGLAYCPGSIELKPFHRIQPQQFLADLQLQTIGAIKVIQAVQSKLKKGGGSIVLFSTVAVQQGFNFHSMVSTSKGAIEGLTRALSAEFAPTIRVNCIAPSLVDTPLAERLLNTEQKKEANAERHPLGRIGNAEDIADIASFLLADSSSWITGQIIKVDGGISSIKS